MGQFKAHAMQYKEKVERLIPEWILAGWDFASMLFREKKNCDIWQIRLSPTSTRWNSIQMYVLLIFCQESGAEPWKQICIVWVHISSSCTKEEMLPSYLGELHNEPMVRLYVLRRLMMNSTTLHRKKEEMSRCTEVLWLCAAEVGGTWVKWLNSYCIDKNIWWS